MLKNYYTADPKLFYNKLDMRRNAKILVYILIGLFIGACAGLYLGMETMPLPHDQTIYLAR